MKIYNNNNNDEDMVASACTQFIITRPQGMNDTFCQFQREGKRWSGYDVLTMPRDNDAQEGMMKQTITQH